MKATATILGQYEALTTKTNDPVAQTVGEVLRDLKERPSLTTDAAELLRKAEAAGALSPGDRFKVLVDLMSRTDPFRQMLIDALTKKGMNLPSQDEIANAAAAIDKARMPGRGIVTEPQGVPGRGEGARQQYERNIIPGRTNIGSAQDARNQLSAAITSGNVQQADAIALNIVRAGTRRGVTADQMLQGLAGLDPKMQEVMKRAIARVQSETR